MKKLIAILTVMIVLVGAVFAVDPLANGDKAQVQVNTEIKLQYPVFSLQATASVNGEGDHYALGDADAMVHGEDPLTPSTMVIGDDQLLSKDVTVTFTIAQTTLSRIQGTYTLSVSAEELKLIKINRNGVKDDPTSAEADANVFPVSAAGTISKGSDGTEPTNTSMVNTTAGQLAITYNGRKVAKDTVLGTFTYTWTHKEDNAAGDYQGNVTLTITSIN